MWARKCQECGAVQEAVEPKNNVLTDAYANAKCRKCRSTALDWGHAGYERDAAGRIVRKKEEDD